MLDHILMHVAVKVVGHLLDGQKKPVELLKTKAGHVAVIGRVNSGKSTLCNVLTKSTAFEVGESQGTTKTVCYKEIDHSIVVVDTPGLLHSPIYDEESFKASEYSELVIFVTTGELYKAEHDFINKIIEKKRSVFKNDNGLYDYTCDKVLVFLNKVSSKSSLSIDAIQKQLSYHPYIRIIEGAVSFNRYKKNDVKALWDEIFNALSIKKV
jgi:GTPase Era involved in 16S rRNA processing